MGTVCELYTEDIITGLCLHGVKGDVFVSLRSWCAEQGLEMKAGAQRLRQHVTSKNRRVTLLCGNVSNGSRANKKRPLLLWDAVTSECSRRTCPRRWPPGWRRTLTRRSLAPCRSFCRPGSRTATLMTEEMQSADSNSNRSLFLRLGSPWKGFTNP